MLAQRDVTQRIARRRREDGITCCGIGITAGRDDLLDTIRNKYLKTGTVTKVLTSRKIAKRASGVGMNKTLDRDR